MADRAQTWKRVEDEHFDLVVIGGGIIGTGAARDAALRGLKVALVEAVDLASGTSSRSSKLVHGGLRYLEQLQFGLVFESVNERQVLQNIAPHLVHPLGFLFPVFDHSPVNLTKLRLGLMVYDGMCLFRSPKLHTHLNASKMAAQAPNLNKTALQGGPLYYDCMTDDARLTLESALDAQNAGAVLLTHAKVTGMERDEQGRITGVVVSDQLGPAKRTSPVTVRCSSVLNATGPWTDTTRGSGKPLLRTTKGVHIVVPSARIPLEHTVVVCHPVDQRVMFVIPWGTETYIGTTDTDYEGDPRDVAADGEDVRYLLEAANSYFPTVHLGPEDVIATWAGLRPLIRQDGVDESAVSREHKIRVDDDGLVTIAGGKLTTYRRMGDEVIDTIVEGMHAAGQPPEGLRAVRTDREPLLGAVGWPTTDNPLQTLRDQVREAVGDRLEDDVIDHITARYGMRAIELARFSVADQARLERLVPGRPELMALVDWAVDKEEAHTVSDVMTRRTQLYFRDMEQGLPAVDKVAARMQTLLGWSDEERAFFADDYRDEVALSRRWRGEFAAAVAAYAAPSAGVPAATDAADAVHA